jgi:hypothetical protein
MIKTNKDRIKENLVNVIKDALSALAPDADECSALVEEVERALKAVERMAIAEFSAKLMKDCAGLQTAGDVMRVLARNVAAGFVDGCNSCGKARDGREKN